MIIADIQLLSFPWSIIRYHSLRYQRKIIRVWFYFRKAFPKERKMFFSEENVYLEFYISSMLHAVIIEILWSTYILPCLFLQVTLLYRYMIVYPLFMYLIYVFFKNSSESIYFIKVIKKSHFFDGQCNYSCNADAKMVKTQWPTCMDSWLAGQLIIFLTWLYCTFQYKNSLTNKEKSRTRKFKKIWNFLNI